MRVPSQEKDSVVIPKARTRVRLSRFLATN